MPRGDDDAACKVDPSMRTNQREPATGGLQRSAGRQWRIDPELCGVASRQLQLRLGARWAHDAQAFESATWADHVHQLPGRELSRLLNATMYFQRLGSEQGSRMIRRHVQVAP